MSDTRRQETRTSALAAALRQARWPLRWTLAGLWAERITRAFWPVWTIALALAAALALGLGQVIADTALRWVLLAALAAMMVFAVWGAWGFRRPGRAEALERLDARLPGRPFAALADAQAIGTGDAASAAVWRAHLRRMAARSRAARAVAPDLRIATRDPFGLRHAALIAFIIAMLFGVPGRLIGIVPEAPPGTRAALAAGPAWEGWIQPPAYTGKPALYLNDIDRDQFAVPQGSRLSLRLYGTPGAVTVKQTLNDQTSAPDKQGGLSLRVDHSGRLAINGAGGRDWAIRVIPDTAPQVAFVGTAERRAGGELRQPFSASDDYGVIRGHATITLDLAAVDRRYGLKVAPEPRKPVTLTLPMPISGSRKHFTQTLIENLAKSPWANLPVEMTLTVEDAAGHVTTSAPRKMDLPGRRFFDPLAAAVIEMRRDLLWSRANGARTVEILRAITDRPDGFIHNKGAYLLVRTAMRRLQAGVAEGLTPKVRDEVAQALWDAAVKIEDGKLSDALARLRQAQDRLSEAIRRGASPDEVQKLMDDLNEAMRNYIRRLAEQQKNDPNKRSAENDNAQRITGDQLQQMLNRLQQLMNEGRMAEAQQLLDQLSQMMQNLRVTQGPGGMQSPGQGTMQDLAETLRKQQSLSDQAFQDLQNRDMGTPDQRQGGRQGQGKQQPGQNGKDQQGGGQGSGDTRGAQQGHEQGRAGERRSLAQRQKTLREELRRQSEQGLPGAGTPQGKAGRDALGRAGRAMEGAERALREGDLSGALDKQAEAMEALRQGMRDLGRAMAQNQQPDQGQRGGQGQAAQDGSRDPLGREAGSVGRLGTSQDMLQGEGIYRRAEEILKELRRRSGDMSRPEAERDYLKRLLEPY
ncbi:ATPase [Defluviimonas sp. 20V17]|uniref:ATPase n=1 Tax=Allgaiera indica TaxID=765699 RepID=A0AAN5A041_9RHOB|nr:TIGR02302 family protein [Allgaiera indica]KDB05555.1 ATPase [Defluviimonas sp. 20V17]GHE03593.1 ATPase [Allgaiera indica]SDX44636.1 TIGR02302 family protein [Allgaiera indica]